MICLRLPVPFSGDPIRRAGMGRTIALVPFLALAASLALPTPVRAQGAPPGPGTTNPAPEKQTNPGAPPTTAGPTTGTTPGATSSAPATTTPSGLATAPAGIMQLKQDVAGTFTYRFVSASGDSTPPAALPAKDANSLVPLSVPAAFKKGSLEVTDNASGNVAILPVTTSGVTSLSLSNFKFVQTVFVPVQSKSLGVYGVLVALTSTENKLNNTNQKWLLKPSDNGVAQFTNVPLGVPVTVTVSSGGNPSKSQTETILQGGHPADGYHWATIQVDWPDVKTVAAPPQPAASTTTESSGGGPRHTGSTNSDNSTDNRPAETGNNGSGSALSGILNVIISLAFLGALLYLGIWAFNKGYIKAMLDKAGINTSSLATTGPPAPNPFEKPAKPPIQPITEGTADPFGGTGAAGMGMAAAPVVSAGPRLVGTMGTYSGNIFQLNDASVDIGRDTANPVALPNDNNVSRRHATIQIANGQYSVIDNGSSNGTFVNGVRIASQTPQPLRPGDEVNIGNTRFRFEA